jgi:hypothetical protein
MRAELAKHRHERSRSPRHVPASRPMLGHSCAPRTGTLCTNILYHGNVMFSNIFYAPACSPAPRTPDTTWSRNDMDRRSSAHPGSGERARGLNRAPHILCDPRRSSRRREYVAGAFGREHILCGGRALPYVVRQHILCAGMFVAWHESRINPSGAPLRVA